jgi:hypothetical protein
MRALSFLVLFLSLKLLAANGKKPVEAKGQEKSTTTAVLETGSGLLQSNMPAQQLVIYLVGLHPMKDHPEKQMEAHHYCRQVNEDLAQCALYDGNTADAHLNGIEYIISEKLFTSLPKEEKKYWHPHNFEILSGQLNAPGLPEIAEKELMRGKMNSYGKTWHVWNTGHFGFNDATTLPLGEPMLAWSLNHDGEAKPGLVEAMEKKLGIKVADKKNARKDLAPLAKPQEGINALRFKPWPKP